MFSMRFWAFLFFGTQCFAATAFALQCRDIFSMASRKVSDVSITEIFAGQSSVGYEYAYFKALRDAGVDTSTKRSDLTGKEKKKMIKAIEKELASGVPVFIDPLGRIFSLDQHHDMFALLALLKKNADPKIPILVLRDFSKEGLSFEEFQSIVRHNGWIYEKNMDQILKHPSRVDQLSDSIARSVIGLAFVEVSTRQNIPLKGKYFTPFVQFQLADFIQARGLVELGKEFKITDVERVIELIMKDRAVRQFLSARLTEDTPRRLEEFLED